MSRRHEVDNTVNTKIMRTQDWTAYQTRRSTYHHQLLEIRYKRRIRETVNRVIHSDLLTVIEFDTTDTMFPADVFSHSGGCHTIPPFPTVHLRWHLPYSSTRSRDLVARASALRALSCPVTIQRTNVQRTKRAWAFQPEHHFPIAHHRLSAR